MTFAKWISKWARDPVSGLTHLLGALIGCFGLFFLLYKTWPTGDLRKIWSAIIFGSSLILLYLSSAAYHLLNVSEKAQLVLRRIDHALIFALIAGSYTPFCLVSMSQSWGRELLIIVWSIALFGLALSLFWIHAPRWLTTALYLFMGWFIVIAYPSLRRALSLEAMYWLAAGGLCYSLGAVIYALKKPDPFPPHFGFHEIWHLMVLAGSACHYMSIVIVLTTVG